MSTKTQMYIVVDKKGKYQLGTLSPWKKQAIDIFLQDSKSTWDQAKEYGWDCIMVDLHITPCKTAKSKTANMLWPTQQ